MIRQPLPNRRMSVNETIKIDGVRSHLTTGIYPDGRLGEIFIVAAKPDSQIDYLLGDAGILTSIMLQSGIPAETFRRNLSRLADKSPASAIGAAIGAAIDVTSVESGPLPLRGGTLVTSKDTIPTPNLPATATEGSPTRRGGGGDPLIPRREGRQ